MPPACTPVAREPIAVASGPGRVSCFSVSALDQRVEQRRHAAGVGVDPAGPVDDRDLRQRAPRRPAVMPVSFSTCAIAVAAASCRSRTTAAASSRVVRGPELMSRRAVRPARSQSTIEEALLIASPVRGTARAPPR